MIQPAPRMEHIETIKMTTLWMRICETSVGAASASRDEISKGSLILEPSRV